MRGGKRPGAGRPPTGKPPKRVLSLFVTEKEREILIKKLHELRSEENGLGKR